MASCTRVRYLFGCSEQIDGSVELTVVNEEVCAALQQLRVRLVVQVLRDHLQRAELLRRERQVQRFRKVPGLNN